MSTSPTIDPRMGRHPRRSGTRQSTQGDLALRDPLWLSPGMGAPAIVEPPFASHPLAGRSDGPPMVVEAQGEHTAGALAAWLRSNPVWIGDALARHGALLFRGFDVPDAPAFESVARAIDDDLEN